MTQHYERATISFGRRIFKLICKSVSICFLGFSILFPIKFTYDVLYHFNGAEWYHGFGVGTLIGITLISAYFTWELP